MTNWLHRAKAEILQNAGIGTANSDDRGLTAVLAVPNPTVSEISRGSIGSNGSAESEGWREIDERRRCDQCANLTGRGLCLAAWRGEIVASRNFEPVCDLPQRCIGYLPKATETDQRTGRERWPGLIQKESKYAHHRI